MMNPIEIIRNRLRERRERKKREKDQEERIEILKGFLSLALSTSYNPPFSFIMNKEYYLDSIIRPIVVTSAELTDGIIENGMYDVGADMMRFSKIKESVDGFVFTFYNHNPTRLQTKNLWGIPNAV